MTHVPDWADELWFTRTQETQEEHTQALADQAEAAAELRERVDGHDDFVAAQSAYNRQQEGRWDRQRVVNETHGEILDRLDQRVETLNTRYGEQLTAVEELQTSVRTLTDGNRHLGAAMLVASILALIGGWVTYLAAGIWSWPAGTHSHFVGNTVQVIEERGNPAYLGYACLGAAIVFALVMIVELLTGSAQEIHTFAQERRLRRSEARAEQLETQRDEAEAEREDAQRELVDADA